MNKNRFVIGLLVILTVFLVGCNSQPETVAAETEEKKLEIIATTFPQYDFIRNIVGDKATVTLLLTPGMETHSFEPSPKDIIDISKSDLFVYTGGESWIEGLNEAVDTEAVAFVSLMEIVTLLEEEMVEGMEHGHDDHDHESEDHAHEDEDHDHESEDHAHEDEDHDHESEDHAHEDEDHDHESEDHAHKDEDHDHESEEHAHEGEDHDHESEEHAHEDEDDGHAYDEHVWLSPENAIQIVAHLEDKISARDENNKEFYETNAAAYIEELKALDTLFEEVTQNAGSKNIIVADRFPFRYLVEAYGLEYHAAFSGCSTQTDASSATVAFLIDTVQDEASSVVFYTEQSNQVLADTIVEGTNAEKRLLHSCHNITKEEIDAGVTYLTLMTQNAEQLREALK